MADNNSQTDAQPPLANDAAKEWMTETDIPRPEPPAPYPDNDTARAQCFAEKYRDDFRHVGSWKQWLCWTGNVWIRDQEGRVVRAAQDLAKQLLIEATEIKDYKTSLRACVEARRAGDATKLNAMINLAQSQEGIAATPKMFDADNYLLGVQNGVVDLRTGMFREMRKEDFITKLAGAAFDSNARCPKWIDFLRKVLGHNQELIAFIQRAVGYSLSGDTSEQALFFLYGTGRNGKSTFTETLQALLGDYAQRASSALFVMDRQGREPEAQIARLVGTRFVVGSEIEEGAKLAENRVKDLTGQDTLTGRFLYSNAFEFKPTHKLWIFGNHKPDISGNDLGIWRRMRLIPFQVQIPETEIDRELPTKLVAELSGILNWTIDGCKAWGADGLGVPQVVSDATEEYRDEEDEIGEFITERCIEAGEVSTADLYQAYKCWAELRGVRIVMKQKTLAKRIQSRGKKFRPSNGKRIWCGLSLRVERVVSTPVALAA